MVPFYEEALQENGFENATSAISAALNDNNIPVAETAIPASPSHKDDNQANINQNNDDVEMMAEDVPDEIPQETKETNQQQEENIPEPIFVSFSTNIPLFFLLFFVFLFLFFVCFFAFFLI